MVSIVAPVCSYCARMSKEGPLTCPAFPDGIPQDMLRSRLDHTKPVDGDHGIQFEQDPAKPVFPHDLYEREFYSKAVGTAPVGE